MKKILISIVLLSISTVASAQQIKAHSVYDVNTDDAVTVSDVTTIVDQLVTDANTDKTVVDTEALLEVLTNIDARLTAIETKVGITGNSAEENLLVGDFSVSPTKTVKFTKGNLYWDGTNYHIETSQTNYQASWAVSHVSLFFWKGLQDSRSETNDKCFCDEENPLTVDGISGLYALSMAEWNYLFNSRPSAVSLYRDKVTVGNNSNCLIIAPDGYNDALKSDYTLEELETQGLLCLPGAGMRLGTDYCCNDDWSCYWSSTLVADNTSKAYALSINSGTPNVNPTYSDYTNRGFSVRLVR